MTTARQSVGELERSRHIPLKVSDASDTAAAVLTDKHETKTNESITAWRARPKKVKAELESDINSSCACRNEMKHTLK
jgi:hypothetical protein